VFKKILLLCQKKLLVFWFFKYLFVNRTRLNYEDICFFLLSIKKLQKPDLMLFLLKEQ